MVLSFSFHFKAHFQLKHWNEATTPKHMFYVSCFKLSFFGRGSDSLHFSLCCFHLSVLFLLLSFMFIAFSYHVPFISFPFPAISRSAVSWYEATTPKTMFYVSYSKLCFRGNGMVLIFKGYYSLLAIKAVCCVKNASTPPKGFRLKHFTMTIMQTGCHTKSTVQYQNASKMPPRHQGPRGYWARGGGGRGGVWVIYHLAGLRPPCPKTQKFAIARATQLANR